MTTLPQLPNEVLKEAKMMWELEGSTLQSGPTASGQTPVYRSDGGGRWKSELSDISLWTPTHRRVWRAMTTICDGGAQPIIVPVTETIDAPWPVVGGQLQRSTPDLAHSDNTFFSDGTGFGENVINATLYLDVALRDTTVFLTFSTGGPPMGGEYFSVNHPISRWRLYRIGTVRPFGSTVWQCTIKPPFREAIGAGADVEFDHPRCVMRLAETNSLDTTLEPYFFGRPSAAFVEAFPPFPV